MPTRPAAPDPLPLPVVDNHTHLDIAREDGPALGVAEAIEAAAAVGVTRLVQIGCDLPSARYTCHIVDEHRQVVGGVALHPNEAPRLAERGELAAAFEEIDALARHPRIRVIGETGLDYFRTGPEGRSAQEESFRWHIDLAKRLDLPVQIHDRDAHDDVLRILRSEGEPKTVVLHCFSGDMAMARTAVERGYLLSFSGTVTFKNAQALRNALAVTPVGHLLVETDAPYLAPTPHRGQTNASYLLPHTVRRMADVLAVDVPALCHSLNVNSEQVYGPW